MAIYDAQEERDTPPAPAAPRFSRLYPKSNGWFFRRTGGEEVQLATMGDISASNTSFFDVVTNAFEPSSGLVPINIGSVYKSGTVMTANQFGLYFSNVHRITLRYWLEFMGGYLSDLPPSAVLEISIIDENGNSPDPGSMQRNAIGLLNTFDGNSNVNFRGGHTAQFLVNTFVHPNGLYSLAARIPGELFYGSFIVLTGQVLLEEIP